MRPIIVERKRGQYGKVHSSSNKDKKYETNYGLPFLNAIAGMVWSIPILQKLLPGVEGIAALGIGAVFTLVYVVLSVMPVIAIVPCIASTIMYTAMFWGIADNIGHIVIRVIVKIDLKSFRNFYMQVNLRSMLIVNMLLSADLILWMKTSIEKSFL